LSSRSAPQVGIALPETDFINQQMKAKEEADKQISNLRNTIATKDASEKAKKLNKIASAKSTRQTNKKTKEENINNFVNTLQGKSMTALNKEHPTHINNVLYTYRI